MSAYKEVLVRASLKDDCIERVELLIYSEEWSAISNTSELAKKIANDDDSRWIPFIDHSGFGGVRLKGNIFSFRCTLVHRANELLDSVSEWLSEISSEWDMVSTSDYIDDGFFVGSMIKPEPDFVAMPMCAGDSKGPVDDDVRDFLPQGRDWSPDSLIGPIEHSMMPINELLKASSYQASWLLLSPCLKEAVDAAAQPYLDSGELRRKKYRS